MRVSQVQLEKVGDQLELSATLQYESVQPESRPLWFRSPAALGELSQPGDAFLPALLVVAVSLGEDLRIEAPVSPELLQAARERLVPTFLSWEWGPREIHVEAPTAANPLAEDLTRPSTSFFSGGVDSWYTVLKRRHELAGLIYVRGVDILMRNKLRWPHALALTQGSAKHLGLPLHLVETNLTDVGAFDVPKRLAELGRPLPHYVLERFSGCMLVSVAQTLQASFGHVNVPASMTYDYLKPFSSHWLVEPAWSTIAQRYFVDGGEAERFDKLVVLREWDVEALRRLRVCGAPNRAELNCGRCEKCLRTLMGLRLCGAEEHAVSFHQPLDLARVKRLQGRYLDPVSWHVMQRAAASRGDRAALQAIEVALGERFDWRVFRRRWRKRWRRSPSADA